MIPSLHEDPMFLDQEFSELAMLLIEDDENPTYKRELLDPVKLDFSMESLRHVDAYLEALHVDPPEGRDLLLVYLRCGAYVGEVMRRQSPGTFHWIAYHEAAKRSNAVAGFGRSIATEGILWKNDQSMVFPLAKIGKFIENGREDSVYYFAAVLLEKLGDAGTPAEGDMGSNE